MSNLRSAHAGLPTPASLTLAKLPVLQLLTVWFTEFSRKNGQVEIKDGKPCLDHLPHLHVTAGNFPKFTDFAVISTKKGFCILSLMHLIHVASC